MRDDPMKDMAQSLLDAMDGVALILDAELRIRKIGHPNWRRFWQDNRGTNGTMSAGSIEATLGQPITVFMAGEDVQQTFAALFRSVLGGRRKAIHLDYRCDAPTLRRDMRLAVTLLETADSKRALLYQSILLSAEPRAPLPLFDAEIAPVQGPDIVTLCAVCARVAWPIGAPPCKREWIEPADYYRRGGDASVRVSHGFCESCFTKLTDEETV